MRILGIDYGSKRIGVAISDESRKFALPVSVIANTNNEAVLREVTEIARLNETREVVMGESRNYKQEPNPIYEAAAEFKKKLESGGFTVYFEPEFMTSVNAERLQGKNEHSDASAAALILQSYLDRQ